MPEVPKGLVPRCFGLAKAMVAAPIAVAGATIEAGAPVALFPRALGGGADGAARQYDVVRDGRFLINRMLDDAATAPITIVQNWNPEAKRR